MAMSIRALLRRPFDYLNLDESYGTGDLTELIHQARPISRLMFHGTLEHLGEHALRLRGQAELTVEMPCARCLKSCELRLTRHVELRLLPRRAAGDTRRALSTRNAAEGWAEFVENRDQKSDEDTEFYEGYELDIRGLLLQEMTAEVPQRILCREDCRGLCPYCGQDLNVSPCGCGNKKQTESAFSALERFWPDK